VGKEIEEGNERGGEMSYNRTGAMRTGTSEQETETFVGNVLRLSSCSGLIVVKDEKMSTGSGCCCDSSGCYFSLSYSNRNVTIQLYFQTLHSSN